MSEEEAKSVSLGSEEEEEKEEKMEVEDDKVKPKKKNKRKNGIKKTAKKTESKKRKYKIKQGTRAIREIKKAQEKTDLLIQYAGMDRFFRETLKEIFPEEKYRIKPSAVKTLMEGTQNYLIDLYKIATLETVHAGRQTLKPEDIKISVNVSKLIGGNL